MSRKLAHFFLLSGIVLFVALYFLSRYSVAQSPLKFQKPQHRLPAFHSMGNATWSLATKAAEFPAHFSTGAMRSFIFRNSDLQPA
jgi:hypothetical protein